MKKALVVGGNSGIGLSCVLNLLKNGYAHVYIVGKDAPRRGAIPEALRGDFDTKTSFTALNLITGDFGIFDEIRDIDALIITAGFGRVAHFEDLKEKEIDNLILVNELSPIRIIGKYYDKISSDNDFYTMVMGSIAGHVASPLFSVYGASKAGLCAFVENVNSELAARGIKNRILDVSPGAIKHTGFAGGGDDIDALLPISEKMLERMKERECLYIPSYDEIYKGVIERYRRDAIGYGVESYKYKTDAGRISSKPQLTIGYLSGTFDLFHIGHLNLLRRAKAQCDYLIVGVHYSGSWKGKETFIPYEERVAILESVKYVDKVVMSEDEDSDAWEKLRFDKLFVGSDYKGTERFRRYEEFFAQRGVEIVYFPYTQGTSSTQLRERLSKK